MPVPPVPQETPEESNSGFKLEPRSPVASLESMEACNADPNNVHLPPILVDFEMQDEAPTSSKVIKKTANGPTGDSSNGNKSSSPRKPSGGKYSDMTKKELFAHPVLSDEEIEKFTKKWSDFQQKALAAFKRKEDINEKYSKTTLFNKVGEESATQRFFKQKHYDESLQKIKGDKWFRDRENDLRD
ncbi:unnamed protein product [Orchesella dallaii]|uniref:Uncharacterized protein n=1 Tax=Orchesella dallaii TaxID=48710 RepID=A0ABP1PLZ1_9HEXA